VYELARLVVRDIQVVVGGKLSQPGVIRRPALETKKPPGKAAISESGSVAQAMKCPTLETVGHLIPQQHSVGNLEN
jgi:hypothetical protein